MKEIAKSVFIQDAYPGVVLGALVLPGGTLLIDAPPRPDDGRAWLSALRAAGAGKERLAVTLDAHPDRTLGARILDCTLLAQRQAQAQFQQRAAVFKAVSLDSGAEWEALNGLSGLRWQAPTLAFGVHSRIHWDAEAILVESHPGPEPGACWVHAPLHQVVFVGDAVPLKQPPFLAHADLEAWLAALDLLLGKAYKGWQVVSARGGLVTEKHIRNFRRALADLHKRLEKIGEKPGALATAEKMIPKLLSAFESPARARTQHTQRLRYGLPRYLHNQYGSVPAAQLGESEAG
ncbi:MAG: MBL fold metallo-hydrolase [Chloroflexi bacterium]|nr:MBL fold metallo-hydrolase [Chloroflexota bacterium]